ncbi:hypothetical protein [Bradyrhizobium tunisiense]|uniref:hypothetical protein n=1 Tax=Bradyrhizobium tunisiense TaxID=3278709 RepID=UPI0035E26005
MQEYVVSRKADLYAFLNRRPLRYFDFSTVLMAQTLSPVLPLLSVRQTLLRSDWILDVMVSVTERFNQRSVSLYSFITQKAAV